MYLREFESTESLIFIETVDFITFTVYEERHPIDDDSYTFPREKVGEFNIKELGDIGVNSENRMSSFISKKYGYTHVYSLNDFREI
jgi:hypothetical protein